MFAKAKAKKGTKVGTAAGLQYVRNSVLIILP